MSDVERSFRDATGRIRFYACPECQISIIFTERKPTGLAHICKKLDDGTFSFLMEIAFPAQSPPEETA